MSDAQVTDVAALADFRVALANFAAQVHQALADLQIESNRAVEWITQDRPQYWSTEYRRSQDAVARAKDDLANSKTFKRIGDFTPACSQEKKVLETAKRRLEHAEQKLQAVKKWSIDVQRAVDKFRGPTQQLMLILDSDIPHAMALLEKMIVALESYTSTSAPVAIKWEDLTGETRSMSQPSEDRVDSKFSETAEDGTAIPGNFNQAEAAKP